jgi:ribosomal protein S18 acetylase RimI-like enzyme
MKSLTLVQAPFHLTRQGALDEATLLVRKGQAYVHVIKNHGGTTQEIASIVAVTRTSNSVSTITKVFTNPRWRRIGCAERLVRYVCKWRAFTYLDVIIAYLPFFFIYYISLLMEKEYVVLYVAHDNPTACNVYERVGFTGLEEHNPDIDRWLEIGFDRSRTFLGHW